MLQSGALADFQHGLGVAGWVWGLMQKLAMHTPGHRVQMVSLADVQHWRLWRQQCCWTSSAFSERQPLVRDARKAHNKAWHEQLKQSKTKKTSVFSLFPGYGIDGQGGALPWMSLEEEDERWWE